MLTSKLRKRRQPTTGPILPHYNESPVSNGLSSSRRMGRSRKRSWQQTTKLFLVRLSILSLAAVAVWHFALAPFEENVSGSPHRSFVHKLREKALVRQWATRKRKRSHHSNTVYMEKTCPDGSKGFIDDNYCDCSDGSDEPNTSACSYILVQKASFLCKNGTGEIYPSRVRDGIIDCLDGSDEIQPSP
jgi:hypothetical protein